MKSDNDDQLLIVKCGLHESECAALAQLCKRIGFTDCRALSVNDTEAFRMMSGLRAVALGLEVKGFAPR